MNVYTRMAALRRAQTRREIIDRTITAACWIGMVGLAVAAGWLMKAQCVPIDFN